MNIAIHVEGLVKRYPATPDASAGFWRTLIKKDDLEPERCHTVLDNISFSLPEGKTLGLMGPNGAGKTTLLRILGGMTPPNEGKVWLAKKPYTVIELGNSFDSLMSGCDNARRELGIYGLNPMEINKALADIHEFSELGDAFYRPIREYSTGMIARLAFSVATAARPEIFLLDEALSVGDAHFYHKSIGRLRDMIGDGTTAVITSHMWNLLLEHSDYMAYLEGGRFKYYGDTFEVAAKVWKDHGMLPPSNTGIEFLEVKAYTDPAGRVFITGRQRIDERCPPCVYLIAVHRLGGPQRYLLASLCELPDPLGEEFEIEAPTDHLADGYYSFSLLAHPADIGRQGQPLAVASWINGFPMMISIAARKNLREGLLDVKPLFIRSFNWKILECAGGRI